jgi:hypothetical protein
MLMTTSAAAGTVAAYSTAHAQPAAAAHRSAFIPRNIGKSLDPFTPDDAEPRAET